MAYNDVASISLILEDWLQVSMLFWQWLKKNTHTQKCALLPLFWCFLGCLLLYAPALLHVWLDTVQFTPTLANKVFPLQNMTCCRVRYCLLPRHAMCIATQRPEHDTRWVLQGMLILSQDHAKTNQYNGYGKAWRITQLSSTFINT